MKGLCRWPAIALAILPLAACGATADIVGGASGVGVGALTANPAVGYSVGLGVRAATNVAVKYVMRKRQQAAQDALAEVAGPLAVGESRPWKIEHDIPIGNEAGELTVVRFIDTPLAACKEVVFSVIDDDSKQTRIPRFTTVICRQMNSWKWAAAEPAVERWGTLH